MFDQVSSILNTFFGRTAGKAMAGIALCFGLGVFATNSLPQYLVTVDVLNAEVLRIVDLSKKGDQWQELNTLELRRAIQDNQLWELEEKVDNSKPPITERQKSRLKSLRESIRKLDQDIQLIKTQLRLREE